MKSEIDMLEVKREAEVLEELRQALDLLKVAKEKKIEGFAKLKAATADVPKVYDWSVEGVGELEDMKTYLVEVLRED